MKRTLQSFMKTCLAVEPEKHPDYPTGKLVRFYLVVLAIAGGFIYYSVF
jgi:hypothetical protein